MSAARAAALDCAAVDTLELTGRSLAVEDVERVALGDVQVVLGASAADQIEASRALIERAVESGTPTYGVNTGFGRFVDVAISREDVGRLQLNLLRSHACAVGEPFPTEVVRGAMLLRANALATGASGVRRETVELLLAMVNAGVQALGLAARGGAQVSTNLIDIGATPLAAVLDEIERLAAARGVAVKGSELVGLMPARVAAAAAGTALRMSGFGADRLLEVASGGEFGEE